MRIELRPDISPVNFRLYAAGLGRVRLVKFLTHSAKSSAYLSSSVKYSSKISPLLSTLTLFSVPSVYLVSMCVNFTSHAGR